MNIVEKNVFRDISWLSFNGRVLQEAADTTVTLQDRIKFLGIFSNNLDEFFRVRVATLQRLVQVAKHNSNEKKHLSKALLNIHKIVVEQQNNFAKIWNDIVSALEKEKVFFKTHTQLSEAQQKYVRQYFDEEVESNVTPLMIQNIKKFPQLREKSLYLAVVIAKKKIKNSGKYALIEVPARLTPRFVQLPSKAGESHIMLLEDVIRFCFPQIFSMFSVNDFESHIVKFTRDAELDIDNDVNTNLIQKIEKGIKQRRLARPVRFIYDRKIDASLLSFLIKKLNLTNKDNLMPGGSIHNFRHFIDFPSNVFKEKNAIQKPFHHPDLQNARTVTGVVFKKDVLLHFPYHSFDAIIDLLREAAISPDVTEIKITAYRLATQSKIINTLINAVKNGKKVIVVMELKARFDEEANLIWKTKLEEDGIQVYIGVPNMKVHAKICLIKKVTKKVTTHYGFISTGNFNEKTAKVYSDCCLLTSNRFIMADANRIFTYLQGNTKITKPLLNCKKFIVSPVSMRQKILQKITNEIKNQQQKKPSGIIIKLNSLTDIVIINKLYEAASKGVSVQLILRGIFCIPLKKNEQVKAISIVDSYLEHSRILYFCNGGKDEFYISSADFMGRNLDHRIEVACPIEDPLLKTELKDFLTIQLKDNTKARILNPQLNNNYVKNKDEIKIRAQEKLYEYFNTKTLEINK
jgi:polyphosphate kinase